ncbi:unnamed protein product [Ilex paraguariensis]|uniref:WRKY domain-containing protein n=1 Tax=Ilex paraguariensis TaxID=185542 RepID=A0ABC8UIB6_9AQUA
MGGFDDHVAIMGDWMPPSSSPRTLFSEMLGGGVGLKSITEPSTGENKYGSPFPAPGDQVMFRNTDEKNGERAGDQVNKLSAFPEQKMSSRGGLVERMAARAGCNAPRLHTESIRPADISQNSEVRSPYLTIPPGLSPTSLLDSPVFLSNSLVQPSPTTGKFPFATGSNNRNSMLNTEAPTKTKDNFFEDVTSSFAFRPVAESGPSLFLGAAGKVTPSAHPQLSFSNIEISVQSENSLLPQSLEPAKVPSQNGTTLHVQTDFSRPSAEKVAGGNNILSEPGAFDTLHGSSDHSPPIAEHPVEDADQRGSADPSVGGAPSEDGYNWRKYGQKQVKGSEYPRSYYKCTHPNCPVKKKVERSHEGHITEIIYKGAHNHPKPPPNRRTALGSSNALSDMQLDMSEQGGAGADGDLVWSTMQKGTAAGAPDWRHDNLEVTSSAALGTEYCNASGSLQAQNGGQFESGDAVDGSSTFSNEDDEDDRGTHGSVSLGYDGEGDESESKRRKIEAYATEMSGASRAIREPRVVVQTTSEVDILDDGYRWRKYGQKVVKGNPNPRSYYKCTSAGCTVRKHVERASHDLKSVITTYEGKHNHDVPAARNSSHVNSGVSNTQSAAAAAVHRPEPSQVHNSMTRFERPPLGSFGLPGRPHLGPSHGFGFGMNQPGLANLAMAGLGTSQGIHPYLGQPRTVNEMGFMLPKGEPKVEPMTEPGLNLSNASSVYHQMMTRLPLGHQM